MNKKDFNPDFNDDDLLVDMTFKVVKFIFTIVAVLGDCSKIKNFSISVDCEGVGIHLHASGCFGL